jgi:hypothetical protein
MERIIIKGDAIPAIFLRAALTEQPKTLTNGLYADAELTINGTVVPLAPAIELFATLLEDTVQQRAVELVLGDETLALIRTILQRAVLDVRYAVSKLPANPM